MSFPRYPKYKPSGVEWLGDVPEHWEVLALKRFIGMQSGETIDGLSIRDEGPVPVYGGNGVRGFTDDATHEGNYALVGRQGALCGNVNYASGRFWASEHAVVVTPKRHVEVRWLCEMLRAMHLNQYSVSAAQPGLSVSTLVELRTALPPLPEQRAIAAFLDRETAKIDGLVAEQQRLIELLKEKRQAVISHAVTKGLDPKAPMKPSGVEWLGDVPAHWEVRRLKNLVPAITVGIVVEPSKHYVTEGIPALRSLNVRAGAIVLDDMVYISEAGHAAHAKSMLHAGDLVAVRTGQPGTTAIVPDELDGCNCVDLIIIREPIDGSGPFLEWYFSSTSARAQFEHGSGGAIQQHFNVGTASRLQLPLPRVAERMAIAAFLDRETSRIDGLIAEAESAITLLQERRSALISAAVTGQIDVRNAVATEAA